MVLPASTGMKATWGGGISSWNPYQPTTISAALTASRSTSTSLSTSMPTSTSTSLSSSSRSSAPQTTPTSFSTVSSPDTADKSPTTAQTAGAVVGGVVGLIILVALFTFLMLRYYRKRRETTGGDAVENKRRSERVESKIYTDDIVDPQAHGGLPSPSYKSELHAESATASSKWHSRVNSAEMEGTSVGYPGQALGSPGRDGSGRPVYEMPG
jgi:hypothetical protein